MCQANGGNENALLLVLLRLDTYGLQPALATHFVCVPYYQESKSNQGSTPSGNNWAVVA